MSRNDNPPISVAEALEVAPSDESWLNDGVTGVVRSIKPPSPQAAKKFWKCVLADSVGSATINLTVFAAPRFSEGDLIEIVGSGVKRKEYNGSAEIGIGKSTEIHVLGKPAHHEEQKERAASGAPAVNGQPQMQNGQAVGNAIKAAHAHLRCLYTPAELREMMKRPGLYWDAAYEFASDQLRISRLLEHGKLKPSIKEREGRLATAKAAPAPTPTPPPKPGPEKSSFQDNGPDEDVPF